VKAVEREIVQWYIRRILREQRREEHRLLGKWVQKNSLYFLVDYPDRMKNFEKVDEGYGFSALRSYEYLIRCR